METETKEVNVTGEQPTQPVQLIQHKPLYITQYIRDKQRRPIGVLLAKSNGNNQLNIGFSLCCWKDKFNKKFGKELAEKRAEINSNAYKVYINHGHDEISRFGARSERVYIPESVYHPLLDFADRCESIALHHNYTLPKWVQCVL